MFKNNHIILKTMFFLLTSNLAFAVISGTVFQDLPVNNQVLNTYGVKDANELGVKGILVTAYPSGLNATTDSSGSWSLATTTDSRIEFSNIPSYLKESPNANVKNASVQFIATGTTGVTFGLHNPADFSDTTNPEYVSNLQQNGTHVGSTLQNLQTVHYNSSELNANYKAHTTVQGTGEIPQDTIVMSQLGSIWGKAYQKNRKRLFVSSMLQRHIGFAHTPADIYVTDYSLGSPSSLLGNFTLQGKVPANGGASIDLGTVDRTSGTDNFLTSSSTLPNIDLDAYAKVGKISYGGISIDHNTNTLWLINLNQKGLISVDISGNFSTLANATTKQYSIENLANAPQCTTAGVQTGALRPWALKIHEGKGYIGAICDGSISHLGSDLSAYILSFDLSHPELGFTRTLDFQLNYQRQLRNWYAWENAFFDPTAPKAEFGLIYGQPIFSDIEFDKNNNMYIAFFDRYATQLGTGNYRAVSNTTNGESSYEYGEILKVCNNNGVYEKEGTGSCLTTHYTDLNISEFFNDQAGDRNREGSLGGLAILKGDNHLLHTTIDPHPESTTGFNINTYWYTHGTHTLNLTDGSIDNWYSFAYTKGDGLNEKANGLGDIELITAPSPTEIGDRIWNDSNANGVQDANETGLAGVKITLVCNGTEIASAITNANGNYIFSNDPNKISSISHIYNITALIEAQNSCLIKIPNVIGSSKQTALNTLALTTVNNGEGTNPTQNDSNAISNGNDANINILVSDVPVVGANNHAFDIGFKPKSSAITSVAAASVVDDCNCTPYEESSIALFDNLLTLLIIVLLTSGVGISLLKKEEFLY